MPATHPQSASSPPSTASTPASARSVAEPVAGQLAVLTACAVASTVIPLPILPGRVLARVRGAVVHEVTARHGLSLTSDARALLAEPSSEARTRLSRAVEAVARQVLRRFTPLSAVSSVARGVEVVTLGLLLGRYLDRVRPIGTVRIDAEEARAIRGVVDRSLLRAFSPSIRPQLGPLPDGAEDLRDELTRWIDSLLLMTSSLPSYVERRLIAAFDEVVEETPGLRRG
jgi:hypothetical protein